MKEKLIRSWCATAICAVAALGFAFVVHASYPGYLHADNIVQLMQIRDGVYSDWQPPFIAALWIGLMKLFPSPVGIVVLDNLLIWGALAAIALGIYRRAGAWSLLIFTIPFMPGVLNFMGHANRDALLAAWALAAFACAFWVNAENIDEKTRIILQILVGVFAIAAFLVRTSAIFALLPLLLYTYHHLGRRRNLLACLLLIAVAMPVAQNSLDRLMNVHKLYPGDSIKTYHLLALSYFEGKNLFPGTWTEDESRRIVEECYSPNQWDAAMFGQACSMIHQNMVKQGTWGSDALTKAWLAAAMKNPVGTYTAMAATFRLVMRKPNSPLILIPPPREPGVTHWEVSPPYRMTTRAAHAWMQSDFNLGMGKPWVFAAVLAICMTLLLVLRMAETRLGLFALALTGSGAIYLLTYFPFNVSAEYRYFYWSGIAAWLGLFMTAMAWLARKEGEKRVLPGGVRLGTCMTIAALVALVATPFKLPMEWRTVTVIPQGEGTLTVSRLRTASRPFWMGNFEGEISAPEWQWDEHGVYTATQQPLSATFKALHQVVRVGLRSGPDGGKARIEDGETVKFVDTRADAPGEIVVDLPPQGTWTQRKRQGSWLTPARAILWFTVLTALLYRLSRPRPRLPCP
ncbi:MAG: hypothetical protein LBP86_05135 [Azoarcus sp.]|jgi:hypothetical protein|nr:hypothetical protein [Azoarcus sp.]